jgi:hypothetical protein
MADDRLEISSLGKNDRSGWALKHTGQRLESLGRGEIDLIEQDPNKKRSNIVSVSAQEQSTEGSRLTSLPFSTP